MRIYLATGQRAWTQRAQLEGGCSLSLVSFGDFAGKNRSLEEAMKIYLVSSVAHQGTGYEHGLEEGGARDLLVSFLDSTGKRPDIWPRLPKKQRTPTQPKVNDDDQP